MVELLFVACLATSPDNCMTRSLLFSDVTPSACLMGAQPELAKWVARHPRYSIASWKCRQVSFAQRDA